MLEGLTDIHRDALREFDRIQGAQRQERLQSLKDRRFYSISGAQWEGDLGRQFTNRPKFEVNKIHLAVIRIINEYRNNRITVDFINKVGKHNDELADTLDGLYRADEQDSGADEAYDNAFEEAVGGGIGAWRLRAVYEDEEDDENEYQRIAIEPIYDADSCVYFDLGAKRQDKSDAKACFVVAAMTPDDFKERWPDEDIASWHKNVHQYEYDWNTPDIIYVAEYYHIEESNATVYIYETIDGKEERYTAIDFENDPNLKHTLKAMGSREIRQKNVKKRAVHKYIMSGGGILENNGLIPGNNIPIVPVYGKRWVVDNVERAMGHVRLSKDTQRLKNMQLSKLAEISAFSSVEKPILTPEQIAGHENMWAEDNIKNYPYVLINPTTDKDGVVTSVAPTAFLRVPDIPKPLAALLALTEQDLKDLLGNQQAGEEIKTNLSGKAVELVQSQLGMQTYIYLSNMAKSIKRSGEIWLGIAKDIFVENNREVKLVGKQNQTSVVKLNKPVIDDKGQEAFENDISKANFDIAVDVGPSSSSKRSATVRALTTMMGITQDPETTQVLSAMTMMNIEGEGVEDVRGYFRQKLIKMGVIKPTDKEREALQAELENQKPDPNDVYLEKAAEAEAARASKARADTILSLAKAEDTRANTIETLAGIDREEQETAIRVLEMIRKPTTAPAQPSQTGENG